MNGSLLDTVAQVVALLGLLMLVVALACWRSIVEACREFRDELYGRG